MWPNGDRTRIFVAAIATTIIAQSTNVRTMLVTTNALNQHVNYTLNSTETDTKGVQRNRLMADNCKNWSLVHRTYNMPLLVGNLNVMWLVF